MTVWAKHYEDLLAELYEMFQKTEFTKAILKDDEESCEIPVHGPLIGAASPVFRDMFCNELFKLPLTVHLHRRSYSRWSYRARLAPKVLHL